MTLILTFSRLLLAAVLLSPGSATGLQTLPEREPNQEPGTAFEPGHPSAEDYRRRSPSPGEDVNFAALVPVQQPGLEPPPVGAHRRGIRYVKRVSQADRDKNNKTSPNSAPAVLACGTDLDQLEALFSDPTGNADLTQRALYLGLGAGTSLASVLNLTTQDQLDGGSTAAAVEYGAQSTSPDFVAESVGKGLMSVLAPALTSSTNVTSVTRALERYSGSMSEGFGRGLAGAAVNFAMQFVTSRPANATGGAKGNPGNGSGAQIGARAENSSQNTQEAVSVVAQAVVNRLTCDGVGGLAQVVRTAVGNNSMGITNRPVDVSYGGNYFSINLRDGSFVSNGLSSATLAILTGAHGE